MRGIVYSTIYTVYTARANPILFSVLYINYTHTCMCMCVYVCVCVCMCMCVCVCVCVCVYVYVYVCMCVCMCMCMCVCMYVIIGNNTLYGIVVINSPVMCVHILCYINSKYIYIYIYNNYY